MLMLTSMTIEAVSRVPSSVSGTDGLFSTGSVEIYDHILLAAAEFACGADCGNKILPRDCRLTLLKASPDLQGRLRL